jgi:hypothetical protein
VASVVRPVSPIPTFQLRHGRRLLNRPREPKYVKMGCPLKPSEEVVSLSVEASSAIKDRLNAMVRAREPY